MLSFLILWIMTRKMGNIEQAQTLVNEYSSSVALGVLRLRHFPPPKDVQIALNLLQKRHPLLQTKITRHAGELFFETIPNCPPISLEVIESVQDGDWLSVVQQEISSKIRPDALLLHCFYIQYVNSDAPVDFIMVFHHVMMDAFSGANLLQELLLLLSGEWVEPLPMMPLLDPCDAYFPQTMQGLRRVTRLARFMAAQMGDELSYRFKTRNGRIPPISQATTNIPLIRRLSVVETRALLRAVRNHDVTMNSAVATAQLLAVHKHLYKNETRPLRTIIFANLRPYLDPPISADNLGCYVTLTRQTVPLVSTPDFWEVAQQIQQNITSGMRRGDGFLNALMSKQLVKMIFGRESERFSATAITYVGALPLRAKYGDIEVVDFHAFLAGNRLGPEFFAFCQIFRGQLSWDFAYLDTDLDDEMANQIADETCTILKQVGLSDG